MNDKLRGAVAGIQCLVGALGCGAFGLAGLQVGVLGDDGLGKALAFVFSLLILSAGVFLWRSHPLGIWLTLAAQLPQVLKIESDMLIYQLEFGPKLSFLLLPRMGPSVGWGYNFNVYIGNHVPEPQTTINLVAILLIGIVLKEFDAKAKDQKAA